MKKKHALALILALFTLLATGCAAQKDGQTTIVTSFYPMYVLTLNVTDGVDGVTVQNMAEQNVGCLHDYQLQTRDMVTLEGADALVINGGGMEQFMDKVISLRADLPVIDASEGIEMFPSDEEHDHDAHGHDDHDELYNAHVWLDPNRAMIQVQNIAAGLAEADPEHAETYQKNAESYIARLTALNAELAEQLAPFAGAEIITFHACGGRDRQRAGRRAEHARHRRHVRSGDGIGYQDAVRRAAVSAEGRRNHRAGDGRFHLYARPVRIRRRHERKL